VSAGVGDDDAVALGALEDRVQHGCGTSARSRPTGRSRPLLALAVVTQRWISEGRILPISRRPKVGMKCLSR
jgi:hypothetical protein